MSLWKHAVLFTIRKDCDSGEVERKIKELGGTVEVLETQKSKLLEAPADDVGSQELG